MLIHPDLMLSLAAERRRDLIAEAGRERLLAGARRARQARRGRQAGPVRDRPTGTLTTCESSAAVSVL
ncbi:hypothetical protein [Actinoplanes sp. NPDC020271]|uniref:hypothetical protein n=1 Tax=Actinoplanes sp. NPDC020271 TaxID=3363896 RepID=UPI0037A2DB95